MSFFLQPAGEIILNLHLLYNLQNQGVSFTISKESWCKQLYCKRLTLKQIGTDQNSKFHLFPLFFSSFSFLSSSFSDTFSYLLAFFSYSLSSFSCVFSAIKELNFALMYYHGQYFSHMCNKLHFLTICVTESPLELLYLWNYVAAKSGPEFLLVLNGAILFLCNQLIN